MHAPGLRRSILALTLAALATTSFAGKVPTEAPVALATPEEVLARVSQSVLPLVGLNPETQEFSLLGNAVVMDAEGFLVAPASVLRAVPASLLLPSPRIGVLVPAGNDHPDRPVSETRVFQRIQVLYLDEKSELSLLKIEGPLRQAVPVEGGRTLALGEAVKVFGFGAPGVLRHLFQGAVAARIPATGSTPPGRRYALDARVTEAADGGLVFDPETGKVYALSLLHLKNVHRVVHKQAGFEYGPTGTSLGIPLDEVRSWVNQHRPVTEVEGGEASAPKPVGE